MKISIEEPHSLNEQSDRQIQEEQFSSRPTEQGLGNSHRLHEQYSHPQKNRIPNKNKCVLLLIVSLVLLIAVILYLQFKFNSSVLLQKQWKSKTDTFQNELKIKSLQRQIKQEQETIRQQQDKISALSQLLANKTAFENIDKQQKVGTISKQNIIDIQYKSSANEVLPINPLKTQDGKGIAHFLYKDEAIIKQRDQFIQQRINFINSKDTFLSLPLAKYNFVKNQSMLYEGLSLNVDDWLRLQKKFQLSSIKKELPMCLIVASFNNNARFRIQGNLNSIFTQNYTNYKVVIINDASTDKSNELYRKYFEFYRIDKSKYVYIENTARVTALQNIYEGTLNQCGKDSIMLTLDGDDQFIGRNVFNVFNWAFQSKKAGVVYSNFYIYQQQSTVSVGFTQQYTPQEKNTNIYREIKAKFSHLRACRTSVFRKLKPQDLKDQKGAFFTMTYDLVLYYPLMELSCGRVEKIPDEVHYLYNVGTGNNDYTLDYPRQVAIQKKIRKQKKYECDKQFNQTMNK